jgi:hypothetical protein
MSTPLVPRLLAPLVAVGLMLCFTGVSAHADQVHMQAALDALRNARAQLAQAEHDKDGHRDKALDLVDRAINQTEMGIKAGR